MLATTVSLASHAVVASLKLLKPVGQVLGYVLPYLSNMTPKINYNTKHLRKGDPLPPYTGKLRVYNMRYCPYAQRAILALNAKQVDFEVVNINLMNKPEWLFSKSGFGKVPALEIEENVCIFESLIAAEYIDEKYPQRPLLSKDPAKKALDKIIIEATAPVHVLFYKSLRNKDSITEADTAAYYKALDFLQNQLKSRGSKFLGGNEPGFVDYMIWPWFERIFVTDGAYGYMKIDSEKYKLLLKYFDDLAADPAIVRYAIPKEAYKNFFDKYYIGGTDFDYDFLLEK